MPAASVWPANLGIAPSSNMSSTTPTVQISTDAQNTAHASRWTSSKRPSQGRFVARMSAAVVPASIATPPKYGIGVVCTSRSRTRATAL